MPDQPRIVVYSCYFGVYEPFNPTATGPGDGYDRVVLTDHPGLEIAGVTLMRPDLTELDPVRQSRIAKMCPHRFFADYDWAIYIDNSAQLTRAPQDIVADIQAQHAGTPPPGRYLFPHTHRTCAYREARLCLTKGKITEDEYRQQLQQFTDAGFPRDQGLYMNTAMIQKMGDPATDALNEAWFAHFQTFSRRDQISLPFLMWQHGYPARLAPFAFTDIAHWPLFSKWKREKFRRQTARCQARAAKASAAA
ncbi:MAG: glycosyltransferase domain-containing protein [Paracoccaceae bacterium]